MRVAIRGKGWLMSFKDMQSEYVEMLRVAGYSKSTLRHITKSTDELFEYLNAQNIHAPSEITGVIIRDYQASLKARNISSVWLANKHTDCRRFLNYLHEQGWTSEDHGLAIGKVIKRKSQQMVLSQEETAALMMQPDVETSRGIRDRALLELLYSSGLRREEVIRIELYDLNIPEGLVKVTGKGNKQRIVPVGKIALYWIDKYIKEVRGVAKDQRLFVGMQTRKGLSLEYLGFLIKSCGRKSGIKKQITPHALRHACATHMMQNGASSQIVKTFLGHEQLMTTQIYTHVLNEDLKKVMNNFHPRRWLNVPISRQLSEPR